MKALSDEQILSEAVALVDEGLAVTMLVKGRSMLPFIKGGLERVVLTRPVGIRSGDVVLARIDGCRYVLHRVMAVSSDRVELMGDGNIAGLPAAGHPGAGRRGRRCRRPSSQARYAAAAPPGTTLAEAAAGSPVVAGHL